MIEIRIPQLGEGLQEARIVRFLKQPGESVKQDEPIYEMETDKAVMEIESPAAGTLETWEAKEDEILPIGAIIGRLNTDGAPNRKHKAEPENEVESDSPKPRHLHTPTPPPTQTSPL